MCSLIILRRPGHRWPLLLAANRDELASRPSLPPGRHWPDRPDVVGGLDRLSDGSWLGLNDHGVVAAVLNREGTLGPSPDKRSRGELVLEALDHAEAQEAAGALADVHPDAYRPFNLIIADPKRAYWLRHGDDGEIRVYPISDGLHMLASSELDDMGHSRVRRFLPLFRNARTPDVDQDAANDQWAEWIAILQRRDPDPIDQPASAMNLSVPNDGDSFCTVASSLIAMPSFPGFEQRPRWHHAHGAPDVAPFLAVDI